MRTAKVLADEIQLYERFRIRILHEDGRDASDDTKGLLPYRYYRAAEDRLTVAEWKEARFTPVYPGYDCQVLDGGGRPVDESVTLEAVRETYSA